jgi:hypothetical protein
MKQITVPYLSLADQFDMIELSRSLDSKDRHVIAEISWPSWSYKPEVRFSIAHNDQSIFLKYYVSERETKTVYTEINDPVYKDSCVEFFISFNQGNSYYNLEFNSKGVCLAGYGVNREERELLPVEVVELIKCFPICHPVYGDETTRWELCLHIPVGVFCYDQLPELSSKEASANFYKCGDDLALPHFLSWNQIDSDEPNFHLPEYFGKLTFASTTNPLNS